MGLLPVLKHLGLGRDVLSFFPCKVLAPMSSTYVSAARDSTVLFRGRRDSVCFLFWVRSLGKDLLEPNAVGDLPEVFQREVTVR